MNAIIKSVFDVARLYKGPVIHAVKGDYYSRIIKAVICVDGSPINLKDEGFTKGNFIFSIKEISSTLGNVVEIADDGTAMVTLPRKMMEEEGFYLCYISVINGSTTLTTLPFPIEVHDVPEIDEVLTEDDPDYETYYSILSRLSTAENTTQQHAAELVTQGERIQQHTVQIEENTKNIESIRTDALETAERDQKRIENLRRSLDADYFRTDSDIAYAKIVPKGALPYAEVTKIGGMTYRDETAGVLKNAVVESIVTTGKNIIEFPYYQGTITNEGVTFTIQDDGGIALNGTPTGVSYIYLMYDKVIRNKGTITLSLQGTYSNVRLELRILNNAGELLKYYESVSGKTINLDDYQTTIKFRLEVKRISNSKECSGICYPMINAGSTALPYEPYKSPVTLPIPAEVQALDGYGVGVDSTYYNYIKWQPDDNIKTFKQYVKTKAFDGTENWSLSSNRCSIGLGSNAKDDLGVCSHFEKSAEGGWAALTDQTFNIYDGTLGIKYLEKQASLSDWKSYLAEQYAAGKPITVAYAVKTPVVTDISDLLPDDNFVRVTEGGAVIAKNANGLDAPTTITYQIKEDAA